MQTSNSVNKRGANRRKFLRTGSIGAGAVIGTALLSDRLAGFPGENTPLNKGDVAILTFLSALEQVEADLWTQYAELGGAVTQGPTFSKIDLPFTTGLAPNYITALQVLDGDMAQYIADNTDDEISHHRFLNNYLASKGASPIDLTTSCDFAAEPSHGSPTKRAAYQFETVDGRYDVVDTIPERDGQPGFRRNVRKRGARPC